MKILRIAQNLYPEVPGGGTYHVHAMSRDQAAMGHDVTVLTVTDDDSLPRQEKRDGYTVVRRAPTVEILSNEISSGAAKFLTQADDYDVVHAHSHIYFSTNLAAVKRRLGDTPLAITNHGLYSQTAPEWVFNIYLRTIGKMTFDSADVVFCYTEEDKERVREFDVSTDIKVVANGIDQTRFTCDGPESEQIETEGPVVLFVGRLVRGKRPMDAIAAIEQVVSSVPDVHLYIVGEGPLHESLNERIRQRGLSSYVSLLEQVPYEEMPGMYRAADILVLPSQSEGVPRTILESLAVETPVVTSNLEQLRDITEVGGQSVPVGDIAGLASAITELLLDDEERGSLGWSGRQLIEDRYTWDDTVKCTTAHLASLYTTTDSR